MAGNRRIYPEAGLNLFLPLADPVPEFRLEKIFI
jgi:hypothetical protein